MKIIFGLSLSMIIYSCVHTAGDNSNLSDSFYSSSGSKESRRMDGNCISCHTGKIGDEKLITLGGTVFKADGITKNTSSKILLFNAQNGKGKLLKTIAVDAEGNFYSNANYSYALPVYPAVVGSSGDTSFMGSRIYTGGCNSCHGVTQAVITSN